MKYYIILLCAIFLIMPSSAIQSCHCTGSQYCPTWGNTISCAPEDRIDPIVTPTPIPPSPKCNNDEIKYYYCEDSNIGSAALSCHPVKEVPKDLALPKSGWYSSIVRDCPLKWDDNNYPRSYNTGGWYYYNSPERPFYFKRPIPRISSWMRNSDLCAVGQVK